MVTGIFGRFIEFFVDVIQGAFSETAGLDIDDLAFGRIKLALFRNVLIAFDVCAICPCSENKSDEAVVVLACPRVSRRETGRRVRFICVLQISFAFFGPR